MLREKVQEVLKRKIIPAILSIVLGIVIIIARRSALDVLVKIIGGIVIAGGIGFIAVYFAKERNESPFGMTLAFAAVTILIGIAMIAFAPTIVDIFPTLVGVVLVLNGLSNVAEAMVDGDNRLMTVILGVLIVLFGIFVIARPGVMADAIMLYIGIFLVINGIFDLVILMRIRNRFIQP